MVWMMTGEEKLNIKREKLEHILQVCTHFFDGKILFNLYFIVIVFKSKTIYAYNFVNKTVVYRINHVIDGMAIPQPEALLD